MMRLSRQLVRILLLLTSLAWGCGGIEEIQDASVSSIEADVPIRECGSVTYVGECVGRLLRWCEDEGLPSETLRNYDCSSFSKDGLVSCAFISDDFGFGCVAPVGGRCEEVGFCAGDFPMCVFGLGVGICHEGVSDCGTEGRSCEGSFLVTSCKEGHTSLAWNCTTLGGGCGERRDDGLAGCIDLPTEQICDEEFECLPNLSCESPDEDGFLHCTAPP